MNFDKCDFKSGSFTHEVEDKNMASLKLFVHADMAYTETVSENVIQSYLSYTESINGEVCKFISQYFPFDPITLKYHVLRNNITLYVDSFNLKNYRFDLKREI